MLYDVIFAVLVAYLLASPFFYAQAVKFGMKIMDEPEKAVAQPIFNMPKKRKAPKMTPEEARNAQIMRNIDAYDGTSNGQVKIGEVDG